jgi:flagellar assembly factor FliW
MLPSMRQFGPKIALVVTMPRIHTKCFGPVEYSPAAVFDFPEGMPGFEAEHAFVLLERPAAHPFMFLQSVSRTKVCFILLPVLAADPKYKLRLAEEDLAALGLPDGKQPRIGKDVLCAVLVCAAGEERTDPTINLLAPIVVNLKRRIGIQAIQTQSGYSYRHPLIPPDRQEELAACW